MYRPYLSRPRPTDSKNKNTETFPKQFTASTVVAPHTSDTYDYISRRKFDTGDNIFWRTNFTRLLFCAYGNDLDAICHYSLNRVNIITMLLNNIHFIDIPRNKNRPTRVHRITWWYHVDNNNRVTSYTASIKIYNIRTRRLLPRVYICISLYYIWYV